MEQLYPCAGASPIPFHLRRSPASRGDGRQALRRRQHGSAVDGKITLNKKERAEPIGSPVDRELMKRIRFHFDAVLRGAETVRANPHFPGVPGPLADRRNTRKEAGSPGRHRLGLAGPSL